MSCMCNVTGNLVVAPLRVPVTLTTGNLMSCTSSHGVISCVEEANRLHQW